MWAKCSKYIFNFFNSSLSYCYSQCYQFQTLNFLTLTFSWYSCERGIPLPFVRIYPDTNLYLPNNAFRRKQKCSTSLLIWYQLCAPESPILQLLYIQFSKDMVCYISLLWQQTLTSYLCFWTSASFSFPRYFYNSYGVVPVRCPNSGWFRYFTLVLT